jgi:putative addiction module component (TIGR02574 family)
MRKNIVSGILELSVAQRILIVQQIWDSIAAHPESLPLTECRKKELDLRLESYYESPDEGITWEELKENY